MMTATRPKLIHFPSDMINFIETYMKENNIKTFSSAVRELLSNQLVDESILDTDEDVDEMLKLYTHASNDEEKYQIKELIKLFKGYFEGRRVYKDLIQNYHKSQYMTLYEYIASNLNPSNAERLMDMFKSQFYIAFDKVVSYDTIYDYKKRFKFLNKNNGYDNMVTFLETEGFMYLDNFLESKSLKTTASLINDIIVSHGLYAKDLYNDIIQTYYEYLNNKTSVYQFANKISQFLEGVKYD